MTNTLRCLTGLAFLLISICAGALDDYEADLKQDCRETWSKVFGPDARDGASWNSEWNGIPDYRCGIYFDEFEQESRRAVH